MRIARLSLATAVVMVLAAKALAVEVVHVQVPERRIAAGLRTVIVSVYAAAEGGDAIASETRSVLFGGHGSFDLPLGGLTAAASGAEPRWVTVRVTPGAESKRVPLGSGASSRGVTVNVVPQAAISAPGLVESTVLGFRFPDGSVQTTAATGATPAFGTPVAVGSANAIGSANTISRSDHVHAHGDQAGGSLHAAATTGAAGFMSAADKQRLNAAVVYARTIVVSPVVGNAVASGDALVAALNGISGNSATNPYLVKIEPGVYDIGANALTMKTYVDVEGSGQNATFIEASRGSASLGATSAAVSGAANSELRHLTITNEAPSLAMGIGFFTNVLSTRLTHVTINSTGATTTSCGIFATSSSTFTLVDVTINATSVASTSGSSGVQLSTGVKASILNSRITAKGTGGTGTNIGVAVLSSSAAATIDGSSILATGSAGQNTGVSVAPGTATITGSTIQADTSGSRSAVSTSASSSSIINVFHSRLLALGTAASTTLLSISKGANSHVRVAASQVDSVSEGTPKCVHVYDADMDDLNNTCPAPIG